MLSGYLCGWKFVLITSSSARSKKTISADAWRSTKLTKAAGMDALEGNIRKLEDWKKQLQKNMEWLRAASSWLAHDRAELRDQVVQLFTEIQETLSAEKEAVLALVDSEKKTCLTLLESHITDMGEKSEELAQLLMEAKRLVEKDISSKDFMGHVDWVLERVQKADKNVPQGCLECRKLDRAAIVEIRREGKAAVRNVGKAIRDKLRQGKSIPMVPPWTIQPKTLNSIPLKPPVPPTTVRPVPLKPSTDIHFTLDPNTAHCNISVSDDLLSAQWVAHPLTLPAHPERFRLHPQVLCAQGLARGEHTWQVEVGGTRRWEVGVTCKSRDKSWVDSCISWALRWDGRQLQAFEGHKRYSSPILRSIKTAPLFIQLHLDCGQKTLGFFTAGEGLLHSFCIKPSGPVFPGFYLEESFVKIKKKLSQIDNLS